MKWFKLIGNALFYYDYEDSQNFSGVIGLEGSTIERIENEEGKPLIKIKYSGDVDYGKFKKISE